MQRKKTIKNHVQLNKVIYPYDYFVEEKLSLATCFTEVKGGYKKI